MTSLQIYAAVDLLHGKSVRLLKGEFDQVTEYGDPLQGAKRLTSNGADWLHIVDLEAARSGLPVQRDLVSSIASAVDLPVQTGGGIRCAEDAEALLSTGIARVVLGTAALVEPELVALLARRYPGKIAVGLDHRGAPGWELASSGWEENSAMTLLQAAKEFERAGAAALIVTSIPTDGTMQGPDLPGLEEVLQVTETISVIASGGVGSLEDVEALARLRTQSPSEKRRRLSGVIIGRAAHDGRVDLQEAARLCARLA